MYEYDNKPDKIYFDASHRLVGHSGLCGKLHGHTWSIEIIVAGTELGPEGILVDFSILKKIINKEANIFDHGVILWDCEDNKERIEHHKKMDDKLVLLSFNPTAENLSKYIYEKIGQDEGIAKLVKVIVQEGTPKGGTAGIRKLR